MNETNFIIVLLSFLFGLIVWLSIGSLDYAVILGVGFMLSSGLILYYLDLHNTGDTK